MTEQKHNRDPVLGAGLRVYFIGIGGTSMAGLAEITRAHGCVVAGSDLLLGPRARRLQKHGITVNIGHKADNIDAFNPDLVVYTAAVKDANPEKARAEALQVTVMQRSVFLGMINREYNTVINIAGTHGKTTTTAMCATILIRSGQDPTVHLGADVKEFDSTVRLGAPGMLMVCEACEYKSSFLDFYSTTAAILNIDFDHVDCFHDLDDVIDVFARFAGLLPDAGVLVLPAFDPHADAMLHRLEQTGRPRPEIVTFGKESDRFRDQIPTVYCGDIRYEEGYPVFSVYIQGKFYVIVHLHIPGEHNVMNALAAIACAWKNGCTASGAAEALAVFSGAEGRFDIRGMWKGATVVSDYAHHPSAARATLQAAKAFPHKQMWVVFQPLTYNRTQVLFEDFVEALLPNPYTIFAEIFSDRDSGDGKMSSTMLVDEINRRGGRADFASNFNEIRALLDPVVQDGDLILVLGPEDIRGFADWLLADDPET